MATIAVLHQISKILIAVLEKSFCHHALPPLPSMFVGLDLTLQ